MPTNLKSKSHDLRAGSPGRPRRLPWLLLSASAILNIAALGVIAYILSDPQSPVVESIKNADPFSDSVLHEAPPPSSRPVATPQPAEIPEIAPLAAPNLAEAITPLVPEPTLPPTSPRGAVDVTTNKIAITGDRFEGTTVRFYNASFSSATNDFIAEMPGVGVVADGVITKYYVAAYENWIGFIADDENGDAFLRFFCLKNMYADLVLELKRGDRLIIEGKVIGLHGSARGVVVTHLERMH